MSRSSPWLPRNAGLAALLSFPILFGAGCGDDTSGGSGDDDAPSDRDADVASNAGRGSGASGSGGATPRDSGAGDAAPTDSSVPDRNDGGSGDGGSDEPSPLGPAPVELGSRTDLAAAGSYVLLAKTGITNVTGSSITGGHLGVSPEAASAITGFSLTAHATNVYSTSPAVVAPGKIYAADYEPPTPTSLTTAVLAMQTAYTDAAGRSDPDFLNLGSGDIGGETLVAGLYKWGTGVTIAEDVTLSGGADDVWIFQISDDLDVSSEKQVLLSGGARASNVFWQVAGQVTIHADAHFEGVILSKTGVTLQTNASLHGRALAQSLIALDDNEITAP